MKKIEQIREQYDLITEKEEAESRKLTTLVRAGLFDPKKLPMLKRALSKDPKDMTPAERKILIELLDSLMAEVLSSQQVYSKVKQNVMMKEDFEYAMARTELKSLINNAQKILSQLKGEGNLEAWVQSKITKAADYIGAAADNLEYSDEKIDEAKAFDGYYSKVDPRYQKMPTEREIPTLIILKRKAIRIYPDNQKVALYYSQALDKYVTIPFGTFGDGSTMNEEIKQDEDDAYIAKSTFTKFANKDDHKKIIQMKQELAKMKASKDNAAAIKAKNDALTTAIGKAKKETVTKKLDLSKVKNTSSLSDNNFKKLKGAISQDKEFTLGGRIGAKIGLSARRAIDKKFTKSAEGAKNINTTFEETSVRAKFNEKLQEKREYGAIDAAADIASFAPGPAGSIASLGSAGLSLSRGDYVGAALDTVGALPLVGYAAKGAKMARAAGKVADAAKVGEKAADAAKVGEKAADVAKVGDKVSDAAKVADTAAAVAKPAAKASKVRTVLKATGKAAGKVAKGVANLAGAALSGLAGGGSDSDGDQAKFSKPKDFQLQAKLSKPQAQVRTAVDAKDAATYRKTMQQNESVLNQLYKIHENEEKSIQIGNESVLINSNIAKKVIGVYESVNKNNKQKIEGMLNESVDSFKKILSFAARQ